MKNKIFILMEGEKDENVILRSIFKDTNYEIVADKRKDDILHMSNSRFDIYLKVTIKPQLISLVRRIYDDEAIGINDFKKLNYQEAITDIADLYLDNIDFSHVFLIYDVDNNPMECISFLTKLFNNSTEAGLLLLSSPMMHSIVDERLIYEGKTKTYKSDHGKKRWSSVFRNEYRSLLQMNYNKFDCESHEHCADSHRLLEENYIPQKRYPVFNLLHILLMEITLQGNIEDALDKLNKYNNI